MIPEKENTTYDVSPRQPSNISIPLLEQTIADIWCNVLMRENIEKHENFIEAGGDSFLLMQMLAEVRRIIGVLDFQQIFLGLFAGEADPSSNSIGMLTIEHLAKYAHKLLLQQKKMQSTPLSIFPQQDSYPLSYAQQEFWLLDQLEQDISPYIQAAAFNIKGRTDIFALTCSLQEIVKRHEILRTTFPLIDGQQRQSIHTLYPSPISRVDLRSLDKPNQKTALQKYLKDDQNLRFDLAHDLLLRITLIQMDTEEHVLIVTTHHIIGDSWSIGLFWDELSALYKAKIYHEPTPPPLSILQYKDYTLWQQQWLQGEVLQTLLSYWKQQLYDAPSVLALPFDRPRRTRQTFHGAHHLFTLSSQQTTELKELGQRESVTLFMLLLAAFQILLFRYSGQEDILVGSPIAYRQELTKHLLGFFANTLVLRTHLVGQPSFRDVLTRVRDTTLSAYLHQDLPFERLIEELHPERSISYNPLFQVLFVLQNTPKWHLYLPDTETNTLDIEDNASAFDISLSLMESEKELKGDFEYNTDLFNSTTIVRMQKDFCTIVQEMIWHFDQPITAFSLVPLQTYLQMQANWQNTLSIGSSKEHFVHELFEKQVMENADAIAVVVDDEMLSYHELNTRSNQLARHLRANGVQLEGCVGISINPSLEMVIGLLGVLKAGGIYVPLDPLYPQERIKFFINDAQPQVILTDHKLQANLPNTQAKVLCLDMDWDKIAKETKDSVAQTLHEESGAYIIYTSGSTGTPKGVVITQKGLVNYLKWSSNYYFNEQTQGSIVHSPLAFDLTVTSLLTPLMAGKTTVLVTETPALDGLGKILQKGYTSRLLKLTPSHLETLNQLLTPEEVIKMAPVMIVGGEALTRIRIEPWLTHAHDIRIINEYGPTETVVGCCIYECTKDSIADENIPIGKPIAQMHLYTLDKYLQIAPHGVHAELYIEGAGLARGYLNSPEVTAERFIPHPFSSKPGARLYKTGDLVRYRPDGNLEFLGRMDQQVKIRGHRVEPSEVAAILSLHSDVKECVVIARENDLKEKSLLAYITVKQAIIHSQDEWRDFLTIYLPEYMLPSAFVILERMPLTTNGKIDIKAFPEPLQMTKNATMDQTYTAIQAKIAEIWRDVLGLEQLDLSDDFFSLGGHSLQAIQVIVRLRALFSVELPLNTLFEMRTMTHLAALIEEKIIDKVENLSEEEALKMMQFPSH